MSMFEIATGLYEAICPTLEEAHDCWFYAFKDAHGWKPYGIDTSDWTVGNFRSAIMDLEEIAEDRIEEEAAWAAHDAAQAEIEEAAAYHAGDEYEALPKSQGRSVFLTPGADTLRHFPRFIGSRIH